MPLKTPEEYEESIKREVNLYMFGEKISRFWEHPYYQIIKPSITTTKKIYELALIDEYKDIMTTTSHLTGEIINRFTSIHQSIEDLLKKVEMQRLLGQKTACCFQRCVGYDAANALYSVTYEIDQKYDTKYHMRFKQYWKEVQKHDLFVAGSMTDPKGDRGKRPKDQQDPDAFLHIVEENDKGIIVRGAKVHQTGFLNSHRALVMPTLAMREGEEDYAVSFGIDTNVKGLTMIYGRQASDKRKLEEGKIDVGNFKYGGQELFVIFDNCFIPHQHIFMNKEIDFTGELVNRFAGYHRQSYACKTGVGDVLIGAAALSAQSLGVANASHIKEKLIEMIHLNETLWCSAVACSAKGFKRPAGNYEMDMLLANVNKQNVTRFPYELVRLAEDIAGGIICTLPSESDLKNPDTSKLLEKYLATNAILPTEDRFRLIRFIESFAMGLTSPSYRTESLHGAGSPQAQRIMIARQGELEKKINLVKEILDMK